MFWTAFERSLNSCDVLSYTSCLSISPNGYGEGYMGVACSLTRISQIQGTFLGIRMGSPSGEELCIKQLPGKCHLGIRKATATVVGHCFTEMPCTREAMGF